MTSNASSSEKYASEYPLPGGVEQYFETLVALLTFIRDNNVSFDDLSKWMFDSFPNASGQIAVNGYISTVGRLGLWLHQDNLVRLSPEGTGIVTDCESNPAAARESVMRIKYRDFLGYDVLLKLLDQGPQSSEQIQEHLKNELSVDWKSKNQSSFRVNWLRSLGYAEKDGQQYHLTDEGRIVWQKLNQVPKAVTPKPGDPTLPTELPVTPLEVEAKAIADRLDKAAVSGGDGKEFEEVTEQAFKFLGFETQLIGGSGNPDVLATASMGEMTYRILIDSKSRTSGNVQQNDVPFLVLDKQKQNASADYVVVVGPGFAGGQLEDFAKQKQVRLLSVSDLREVLLAHAQSAFVLDVLRPLFMGGGAISEGALLDVLGAAESSLAAIQLGRKIFAAVKGFQDKSGAINSDSLYFILKCEHAMPTIRLTVDFLKSELIGALGETENGSLYTRMSPATLTKRLIQIAHVMNIETAANA
jgi:hypothetical protein